VKSRFGRSRWRGGRYRVFGGGSLCGMMQELGLQVISERYLNHILSASADCGKLGA
jgi:hypothetical protein